MQRYWICLVVNVLLYVLGRPSFCDASDDDFSRRLRIGGAFSYLVFLQSGAKAPLLSAHVQYPVYKTRWTVDLVAGISRSRLKLYENTEENKSTLLPIKLGTTCYLSARKGRKTRKYVTVGFDIFNIIYPSIFRMSPFSPINSFEGSRIGWLMGPYGAIGIEMPLNTHLSWSIKLLELSYHRAFNKPMRAVDGLVIGFGIGVNFYADIIH